MSYINDTCVTGPFYSTGDCTAKTMTEFQVSLYKTQYSDQILTVMHTCLPGKLPDSLITPTKILCGESGTGSITGANFAGGDCLLVEIDGDVLSGSSSSGSVITFPLNVKNDAGVYTVSISNDCGQNWVAFATIEYWFGLIQVGHMMMCDDVSMLKYDDLL